MPVDKTIGDTVFAGSLNNLWRTHPARQRAGQQIHLARILHAIVTSRIAPRPATLCRSICRRYTPAVLALLAAVAPAAGAGPGWLDSVYQALVMLVIACPCALVISAVTLVSGLAAAARHGVLVKGGAVLEQGAQLRAGAGQNRHADAGPARACNSARAARRAGRLASGCWRAGGARTTWCRAPWR